MTWKPEHRPREIHALPPWVIGTWRFKPYFIDGTGEGRITLTDRARSLVKAVIADDAGTAEAHGLGFVLIHPAAAFDTIAVDFWENDNELRHRFFRSPSGAQAFVDITATGRSACVWELAVQAHEARAWTECVLAGPDGPDVDAYLGARLEGRF